MYYVYMIKNDCKKLYVGVSANPQRRLNAHNNKQGARFTKHLPTYQIAFLEKYQTISEARKREIQIKKWRRGKKESLIKRYQQNGPTML